MLALTVALLPWVALSRIGEWRFRSATATPSGVTDAIESVRSSAVVTLDRLSFAPHGKRADGTRQVWTTPPVRSGTSPILPAAWDAWPPVSIVLTDAVAFCLSCRGPPPLATT